MDINQSNLDILFRGWNLDYQGAYDKTPVWYNQIATTIPSNTSSVTYGWMATLPILRKWVGPRVVNAVAAHARVVVNDLFEDTIALDKFNVADDQYGLFSYSVKSFGSMAAKWPDQRVANWMRSDANTVNGFDGVPQFSTVHPILGGDVVGSAAGGFGGITGIPATQSNLLLSTALTYDNYVSARKTMRNFRGENGQPLGVLPNVLVVPPDLEGIGKLILEADFESNINSNSTAPQSNVWKNSAKLLVIPELADKPNNWWLLDTTKVVNPFLWQLRQPPVLTPRTAPTDPAVFDLHQFLYGIEARGTAAETLWFLSLAGTSAAAY